MPALSAKQMFFLESTASRKLYERADRAALGLTANPFSLLGTSATFLHWRSKRESE